MPFSSYVFLDLALLLGLLSPSFLLLVRHRYVTPSEGIRFWNLLVRKLISTYHKLKCLPYVRHLPGVDIQTPCETAILQAEAANRHNGHENQGPLSFQGGFVPLNGPVAALPESYKAWDDLVSQLPQLVKTQTVQDAIHQLPVLEAQKLPDQYLQRAASVIGILSHAYVRLDGQNSLRAKVGSHREILPASLYIPWTQICERLGRSSTSLTFIDLVLYNFSTTATNRDQMNIENSKLLLPTVDNVEERTFYGVMIETNSKAIPVIRDIVEAQKSVLMNDKDSLEQTMRRLVTQLQQITKTISKLNAKRISPVVWTKTVANLAIPWVDGLIGSAGTAHPFFHLMDEFLERHNYDTRVGKEAMEVRSHFPKHWRDFISAAREVSIAHYVEDSNNAELARLWQSLKDAYLGDSGLLGFHRRKVYGFLAISFRIGRNSTINGLGAQTARESCNHVDGELEQSRTERCREGQAELKKMKDKNPGVPNKKSCQSLRIHELIQHNNKANGFWFTACGKVYDATPFMTSHPGGEDVIAIVSGQDATRDLGAVAHLSNPATKRLLDRFEIGTIQYRHFSNPRIDMAYNGLVQLAYKFVEIESVYNKITSAFTRPMTSADLPCELNALKTKHYLESMGQLRGCFTMSLVDSFEILNNSLETQGRTAKAQSSTRAMITHIKSQTEDVQPLSSDLESKQDPITWDIGVKYVRQNRELLGKIKTVITDILVYYDRLNVDIEKLSKEGDFLVAEGLMDMTRNASQLGRQTLTEVEIQ